MSGRPHGAGLASCDPRGVLSASGEVSRLCRGAGHLLAPSQVLGCHRKQEACAAPRRLSLCVKSESRTQSGKSACGASSAGTAVMTVQDSGEIRLPGVHGPLGRTLQFRLCCLTAGGPGGAGDTHAL